jgi:hypothetical protein
MEGTSYHINLIVQFFSHMHVVSKIEFYFNHCMHYFSHSPKQHKIYEDGLINANKGKQNSKKHKNPMNSIVPN